MEAVACVGERPPRPSWAHLLIVLLLEPARGVGVLALFIAWPWLLFFLIREGLLPHFWLFGGLLALLLALILFALIDPALKARPGRSYSLRPLNRRYVCAGAVIAGWVIAAIPCIAAYNIPASGIFSGSVPQHGAHCIRPRFSWRTRTTTVTMRQVAVRS
jgi:hypothetical protein